MALPTMEKRPELWESRRHLGFLITMAEKRKAKAEARYADDLEKIAEAQARVDELEQKEAENE
ncbi:hypothetical protein [Arthrobacter sp. NPDC056493]|uniref:hypothetical protein n=1 Tax=Arthrobacter sp. NPDC056493 TaxID=3345839 RepID=UPI00366D4E26